MILDIDKIIMAVRKFRDAETAAHKCPEMILSSGNTHDAKRLMKELSAAKFELFKIVGINESRQLKTNS